MVGQVKRSTSQDVAKMAGVSRTTVSFVLNDLEATAWGLGALSPRQVVNLTDISPHLLHAVVAVEDERFWRHPGVDPLAVARALRDNLRSGRRVSGASTLAMQVARMQHPGRTTGSGCRCAPASDGLRSSSPRPHACAETCKA